MPPAPRLHPGLRPLFATLILALTPHLPASGSIQPSATPTSPFIPLTHDAALARAKAENKPLLLFFDGHWSDDAARLRRETFSDPKIISLLQNHAIALRIDVLTAPELTAKYRVLSVPAMIALDETGTRRQTGWNGQPRPSARTLDQEFTEFFVTIPALRHSNQPHDYVDQYRLANLLQKFGYREESLAILRYLYLDVIGGQETTPDKKTSKPVSAFDVIKLLGVNALGDTNEAQTIHEFMQIEETRIIASPANALAAKKFARLASAVGEFDKIKTLADSLPSGKARNALVAHLKSLGLQK